MLRRPCCRPQSLNRLGCGAWGVGVGHDSARSGLPERIVGLRAECILAYVHRFAARPQIAEAPIAPRAEVELRARPAAGSGFQTPSKPEAGLRGAAEGNLRVAKRFEKVLGGARATPRCATHLRARTMHTSRAGVLLGFYSGFTRAGGGARRREPGRGAGKANAAMRLGHDASRTVHLTNGLRAGAPVIAGDPDTCGSSRCVREIPIRAGAPGKCGAGAKPEAWV